MTVPHTRVPQPHAHAPSASGKSETLYRALLDGTRHATKRANLEHLWQALETMRARRQTVFSIAEVARTIVALKLPGPAEQSIRNKPQGNDFTALIAAYAEDHGGARRRAAHQDEDEDVAAEIGDHRVAARVRLLQARLRALQQRNDILHRQYQQLTAAPAAAPQGAPALPSGAPPKLPEHEARAVTRFLERVEMQGWRTDDATGAILDHHDFEVAPPHFVHALRRVTGRA